MQAAKGDFVTVMDADLQDPPTLLPEMFAMLEAKPELDCIGTRRADRKGEPKIRSFSQMPSTILSIRLPILKW